MVIEMLQSAINWVLANPQTAFTAVASVIGASTVALRTIAPLTKWKGDNKALAFMRDVLSIMSLDSEARKVFEKMGLKREKKDSESE